MSQGFKLKFDHLKENDPTKQKDKNEETDNAFYPSESNTRNLCLEWLDGRMQFLNYAYLISGEFAPIDGKITLTFTTHRVHLTGRNLNLLFQNLSSHLPKLLTEIDSRYDAIESKETFIINKIESISNEP